MAKENTSFTVTWRKYSWHLTVNSKYTLVDDVSGTGKSFLCAALQKRDCIIEGSKFSDILAVSGVRKLKLLVSALENALIVIDDDDIATLTEDECSAILNSTNAFMFISRNKIPHIPFGLDDVFVFEGLPHNVIEMKLKYNVDPIPF